jgi:hypothetical protein
VSVVAGKILGAEYLELCGVHSNDIICWFHLLLASGKPFQFVPTALDLVTSQAVHTSKQANYYLAPLVLRIFQKFTCVCRLLCFSNRSSTNFISISKDL